MNLLKIIIFSLILFLPVYAYTQNDDSIERIKKLEKEIEKKKNELNKNEKNLKNLKSREKKVMGELEISEKKIENIHKNLKIINEESKIIEKNIDSSRISYQNAKDNFAKRSDIYKKHLRSMYKRQKISPVGMIFSTGSVSAMLRGFKMFHSIAEADAAIMGEMEEQAYSIRNALEKLETALNSKIALQKAKRNEQLSLANLKEKKKKILSEIVQDEKLHELRIKKFRSELTQSQ